MAGTSASARFFSPYGVAVSPDGKTVYVGEAYKNRIRAVSVEDGVITTLAGSGNRGFLDGDAGTARFSWPYGRAGHH
jgi:sugar lactone lactonase YvrE